MKKILFIAIALLLLPTAVLARQADPNRLPKNEPLRPPAQNISPNYQGNVNFSAEPAAGSARPDEADRLDSPPGSQGQPAQNQDAAQAVKTGKPANALWFALIGILVLILVYGFWRKRFNRKS